MHFDNSDCQFSPVPLVSYISSSRGELEGGCWREDLKVLFSSFPAKDSFKLSSSIYRMTCTGSFRTLEM